MVHMEVFADPKVPPMSLDERNESCDENQIALAIHQLETMSEEEIQDQVHRRFEYYLCGPCHRRFLANPLGLPRSIVPVAGAN